MGPNRARLLVESKKSFFCFVEAGVLLDNAAAGVFAVLLLFFGVFIFLRPTAPLSVVKWLRGRRGGGGKDQRNHRARLDRIGEWQVPGRQPNAGAGWGKAREGRKEGGARAAGIEEANGASAVTLVRPFFFPPRKDLTK